MTTLPNALTSSINHERSPALLTTEAEHNTWLTVTPDESFALVRPYPAEDMHIVQEGFEKRDLL